MLRYKVMADKGSMYNTPNTFGIYVCGKIFRWIEETGGLIAMEHGYRQGEAVRRLLMEAGYGAPRTEQDLAGLDRCTWARRG